MNYRKFALVEDLIDSISPYIKVEGNRIEVKDLEGFREKFLDHLVFNLYFSPPPVQKMCSKIIREASKLAGIRTESLYRLYKDRGAGKIGGFTVPAINVRVITYDIMRTIFRLAKNLRSPLFLFEIARSELSYTGQTIEQYSACAIASALRENYPYPLFLQGDHFQIDRKKYEDDEEGEIEEIKNMIRSALECGVYNIDLDCSTLVDESLDDPVKKEEKNAMFTAELTKFIRSLEEEPVVNIGGEIGEIGKRNSTPEDLEGFMKLYLEFIEGTEGISKISVQTGTRHGGFILPDGSVKEVDVDFETLRVLSKMGREKYGLAGAVQHGASTLPIEVFPKFVEVGTAEIHLATLFMRLVLGSKFLPDNLKEEIREAVFDIRGDKRKDYETDEQFIASNIKFIIKPYGEIFWKLPDDVKSKILREVEEITCQIFESLRVTQTDEMVEGYFSNY